MNTPLTISTYPVSKCLICQSEGKLKYENLDDRNFGETKNWNLVECINPSCKLIWLNPMPTPEDIGKAYASYYTHSNQKKSLFDFSFLEKPYLALKYGYREGISFVEMLLGFFVFFMPIVKNRFDFSILYLKRVRFGKVLDFGCGNGWTLDNLKNKGWDCYGLDFDPKAVEFCQSKGLKVNLGDIASQNYPDNYFDAITINHVIEHVHEVDKLIGDCFKKLKPGGKLVIATPNTENWQHGYYGSYWFQLDPPRHLHLFNIKNLEVIVKRNQFSVEKSFSSFRMDAWSTIVTRGIKRNGKFLIGKEQKTYSDLFVGLLHQNISFLINLVKNNKGGEIILVATKK